MTAMLFSYPRFSQKNVILGPLSFILSTKWTTKYRAESARVYQSVRVGWSFDCFCFEKVESKLGRPCPSHQHGTTTAAKLWPGALPAEPTETLTAELSVNLWRRTVSAVAVGAGVRQAVCLVILRRAQRPRERAGPGGGRDLNI